MPIASLVLATIAALLHVLFWVLESLRFGRPEVWRRFGAKSQEEAEIVAPMAFNQGFYNLFLALGALAGVGVAIAARRDAGWTMYVPDDAWTSVGPHAQEQAVGSTLIVFTMLCMLGAALVLVLSDRRMARAAAIQGTAPALALLIAAITALTS